MLAGRERFAFAVALHAAWHAEAFGRCRQLPELAPLLDRVRAGRRDEQDAEEQLDAARAIAAAFGAESLRVVREEN